MSASVRLAQRVALLAAAGLLAMGAATTTAQAASVGAVQSTAACGQAWDADFNTDGVNIRSGPGTGYGAVGAGYRGDKIDICASVGGESIACANGRVSAWWDQIIDRRTGVQGYISQCFVNYVG
jgi:uncharacterized protein YraI